MFKTSAIHPPPNLLGGGLLAEDDKTGYKSSFKEITDHNTIIKIEGRCIFCYRMPVTQIHVNVSSNTVSALQF